MCWTQEHMKIGVGDDYKVAHFSILPLSAHYSDIIIPNLVQFGHQPPLIYFHLPAFLPFPSSPNLTLSTSFIFFSDVSSHHPQYSICLKTLPFNHLVHLSTILCPAPLSLTCISSSSLDTLSPEGLD